MADNTGSLSRVKLHKNGPEFSSLIWGSMRSEEQFTSAAELADFLRFLLDQGITTLDTANTYGSPHPYTVEEFLGDALRQTGLRDRFEIVTKCGIQRVSPHRTENRIRHFDFTEAEIRRSVDRSLNKLGIDYADVILLHRPDYLMDPTEAGGTLDALIAEGKTRYVGVSNFSPSRYHLLASKLNAPIVTNQVEFSPIHLDPIANGVFDTAMIEGHVPMIWSPIGGGRLMTGDDPYVFKVRAVLSEIAARNGLAGPAEAAIAFVARHPAKGIPIIGSGKHERLTAAIEAVNKPLDRQDWYEVVTATSPMLEL
ncbi:aldo/keto reductase [Bauldia sp.]|uniref:aldo/keto reductase n=1 Tax=Bauldia sp. TaxID=2575872 RepID=UPI003BAC18B9